MLQLQASPANRIRGVHVVFVEPAQAAGVVAVGVRDDQDNRLVRDLADDGRQVADARARVDDHGLVLAHQHEDGPAVKLVDLVGVLGDLHNGLCSRQHLAFLLFFVSILLFVFRSA